MLPTPFICLSLSPIAGSSGRHGNRRHDGLFTVPPTGIARRDEQLIQPGLPRLWMAFGWPASRLNYLLCGLLFFSNRFLFSWLLLSICLLAPCSASSVAKCGDGSRLFQCLVPVGECGTTSPCTSASNRTRFMVLRKIHRYLFFPPVCKSTRRTRRVDAVIPRIVQQRRIRTDTCILTYTKCQPHLQPSYGRLFKRTPDCTFELLHSLNLTHFTADLHVRKGRNKRWPVNALETCCRATYSAYSYWWLPLCI